MLKPHSPHELYSQPIAASIEEIDSDEEITEFPNANDDSKVKPNM